MEILRNGSDYLNEFLDPLISMEYFSSVFQDFEFHEFSIRENIRFDKYADGKTAIYISHRMSSTKLADKIIVFNNGEIVEAGTFDELMSLNGYYAENFNLQAAYYTN